MSHKDPEKRKAYEASRHEKRLVYWREYRKLHPQIPDREYQARYRLEHGHKSSGESIGYKGEQEAYAILKGSERHSRRIDMIWKDKLIDIKTARKATMLLRDTKSRKTYRGKTYFWKFLLKQKGEVDFFLFVLKDTEGKTERILLIPDKDIGAKHFKIAESKLENYSKYEISY